MKYIVRPRNENGFGSVSVVTSEAEEALNIARDMIERGVEAVEIFDTEDNPCDLAELERVTTESAT